MDPGPPDPPQYRGWHPGLFATWCPAGTPIAVLVTVEGQRWAIEDSFETAKNELGLDHNETRSWHGWHRHVSLVMLAFAMLAVIRHHANQPPPPKTLPKLARPHPLVAPGDPPRRHTPRPAAHPAGPHHRLVMLATRPPSQCTTFASEATNATVMLGDLRPAAPARFGGHGWRGSRSRKRRSRGRA